MAPEHEISSLLQQRGFPRGRVSSPARTSRNCLAPGTFGAHRGNIEEAQDLHSVYFTTYLTSQRSRLFPVIPRAKLSRAGACL